MIEFSTSWPHRNLHANSKPHWRAKANSIANARLEAAAEARKAGAFYMNGERHCLVAVKFIPPVRRGRQYDPHNLTSQTVKAHIDGIADALNVDDKDFHVRVEHASREGEGRVDFTVMPFRGEVS